MPTTALTPDALDAQAARLHDTDAWQQIVTGWDLTAPSPSPAGSPIAPAQPTPDPMRRLARPALRAGGPADRRHGPLAAPRRTA